TGWVLTDWFENLFRRVGGPERYDALAEHRLAWTDPSVVRTLELLARLVAPTQLAGGPAGALRSDLADAAAAVFSPEPGAAIVIGGDFVPGVVAGTSEAAAGVGAGVGPVPAPPAAGRAGVRGGAAAVATGPA